MPLDTYANLCATVARWLERSDLSADIPDFIALAEAKINDRLRVFQMESTATLTGGFITLPPTVIVDEITGADLTDEDSGAILTDETVAVSTMTLPDDFLELRFVTANTNPKINLTLASPGMTIADYSGLSGIPYVYTIAAGNMIVYPATTETVALTYYAKIPPLSDANPTNWLLARWPNIYLYAALLEGSVIQFEDQRAAGFDLLLDKAIAAAHMSDIGTRWGNAGLRLRGPTP